MKKISIMNLVALGLISALAIGCGDDDPDPAANNANNTNVEDLGSNNEENNDDNNDGNNGEPDMGDEMADAGNNDEGDTDVPCDPDQVVEDLLVDSTEVASATVEETTTEDGIDVVRIDASLGGTMAAAESSWVYVDLTEPAMVEVSDADALTNADWDLAFKRAEIRLNSADSGPRPLLLGKVESAFDEAMPPAQGGNWVSDEFVGDDCEVTTYGRGSLETAFGQWYDYDPMTHTVSAPEDVTYFIYDPTTHAVIQLSIVAYDDGVYDVRVEAQGGS